MTSQPENNGLPWSPKEEDAGFESLARESRQLLRSGGPEVDLTAVHMYIAGALSEDEAETVRDCILTWEAWNRAYWEIMSALGQGE